MILIQSDYSIISSFKTNNDVSRKNKFFSYNFLIQLKYKNKKTPCFFLIGGKFIGQHLVE